MVRWSSPLSGDGAAYSGYKQDRIFHLAERFRLPVVIYTEGGGGRPGDTDTGGGIGMDVETFTQWSRLSGLVPLVGINSGYCFAGNTALLGCCDVFAAIEDPEDRVQAFNEKVSEAYEQAKAVNAAEFYGIDDVIDPAQSRAWVIAGLRSLPPSPPRTSKKRPFIDTW